MCVSSSEAIAVAQAREQGLGLSEDVGIKGGCFVKGLWCFITNKMWKVRVIALRFTPGCRTEEMGKSAERLLCSSRFREMNCKKKE